MCSRKRKSNEISSDVLDAPLGAALDVTPGRPLRRSRRMRVFSADEARRRLERLGVRITAAINDYYKELAASGVTFHPYSATIASSANGNDGDDSDAQTSEGDENGAGTEADETSREQAKTTVKQNGTEILSCTTTDQMHSEMLAIMQMVERDQWKIDDYGEIVWVGAAPVEPNGDDSGDDAGDEETTEEGDTNTAADDGSDEATCMEAQVEQNPEQESFVLCREFQTDLPHCGHCTLFLGLLNLPLHKATRGNFNKAVNADYPLPDVLKRNLNVVVNLLDRDLALDMLNCFSEGDSDSLDHRWELFVQRVDHLEMFWKEILKRLYEANKNRKRIPPKRKPGSAS